MNYRLLNEVLIEWNGSSKQDQGEFISINSDDLSSPLYYLGSKADMQSMRKLVNSISIDINDKYFSKKYPLKLNSSGNALHIVDNKWSPFWDSEFDENFKTPLPRGYELTDSLHSSVSDGFKNMTFFWFVSDVGHQLNQIIPEDIKSFLQEQINNSKDINYTTGIDPAWPQLLVGYKMCMGTSDFYNYILKNYKGCEELGEIFMDDSYYIVYKIGRMLVFSEYYVDIYGSSETESPYSVYFIGWNFNKPYE